MTARVGELAPDSAVLATESGANSGRLPGWGSDR